MKRLIAAVMLALSVPIGAQEAPEHSSAAVRTTFVVRDIDRSVRFYREVFGYRVKYDGKIGATPQNRVLLALKGKEDARFVILDGERTFSGKAHDATGIGLIAFTERKTPRLAQPKGNRFASGQAMLAIMTSDIAAVMAGLKKHGAPILAGPVIAKDGRETEIVTSDPDGTRIHVVEQRPR
jgi:catechol 2,3-dioxygenase-like lactoylglutathione lyase family enzyme